ncbi:hypothetical protein [Sporomusa aerivorans]|uniref:TipJ family phage tail tip protein n=1 Tax=Sporomusa aerivorans TaxID=204936 RepID=UPI00352B32A9
MDGDKQYLSVLYTGGQGPVDEITDIEINGNPVENYTGVQVDVRLGTNDQEPITNFSDTYANQSLSYELQESTWSTQATDGNAGQGLRIDVEFPNGLYHMNDNGGLESAWVRLAAEYRIKGGEWVPWLGNGTYVASTSIAGATCYSTAPVETWTIEVARVWVGPKDYKQLTTVVRVAQETYHQKDGTVVSVIHCSWALPQKSVKGIEVYYRPESSETCQSRDGRCNDGKTDLIEDFCIHIDFDPTAPNPERVFDSIAKLIKSFQEIDRHLVTCVDTDIEPILVLEDIEKGSIKVWIAQKLKDIPDAVIKDGEWKKVLGHFLVQGKHSILRFLEENNTITCEADIIPLEGEIKALAEDTELSQLNCYTPLKWEHLISDLKNITVATQQLAATDRVTFYTNNGACSMFNPKFDIPAEVAQQIISSETTENTAIIILKAKKPDFLGESQWTLKFGNKTIDAKILDEEWLQDFRNRLFYIGHGDSIRAEVKSLAAYGKNYEVIDERHSVLRVIEILPNNESKPVTLFPPN